MIEYPKQINTLLYYKAFRDRFAGIPDHNGDAIPIVPATPDRAFATAKNLLQRPFREPDEDRLMYPLLSFFVTQEEYDGARASVCARLARLTPDQSEAVGYAVIPKNLNVQLDLWCPDAITTVGVTHWIDTCFGPTNTWWMPIDFTPFFDFTKDVQLLQKQRTDNSELEGGEDKDFRVTWDVEVIAWIVGQASTAKTLVNTDVDVGSPSEALERWHFAST